MGQQQTVVASRRRISPAACRAGTSGSDSFTSFVLNITLWRLLSVAGSPIRQIVSFYVFTGRSCWSLLVDLQRWLWRAMGWLSAPPRSAALQRFGRPLLDVRRWHYGLGERLGAWPPSSSSEIRVIALPELQGEPLWQRGAQKLGLQQCYRRVPCQHGVLRTPARTGRQPCQSLDSIMFHSRSEFPGAVPDKFGLQGGFALHHPATGSVIPFEAAVEACRALPHLITGFPACHCLICPFAACKKQQSAALESMMHVGLIFRLLFQHCWPAL